MPIGSRFGGISESSMRNATPGVVISARMPAIAPIMIPVSERPGIAAVTARLSATPMYTDGNAGPPR